jgi:hypothetical protein
MAFSVDEKLSPISVAARNGIASELPMKPIGTRSDLTGALRDLQDQLRGQTVQAILLFSDGRQVGGEAQPAAAGSVLGAPLFAPTEIVPGSGVISAARASSGDGIGGSSLVEGTGGVVPRLIWPLLGTKPGSVVALGSAAWAASVAASNKAGAKTSGERARKRAWVMRTSIGCAEPTAQPPPELHEFGMPGSA